MRLAQTARTLLENEMVNQVFGLLFKQYQTELLASQPGDLTAVRAHARMLGLKAIQEGLQSFVNDAKIAAASKTQEDGSS